MIDKDLTNLLGESIALKIQDRILKNRVVPKTNKENGKATLVESGRLHKSIKYITKGNVIIVGTNVKYARIHHEGGVIVPRKAKYLAVPINPIAKGKSPRDFSDTFIRKSIIFRDMGKGKVVALYALKKKVTIPARPYMFLDSHDKSDIQKTINNYFITKIKEVADGIR